MGGEGGEDGPLGGMSPARRLERRTEGRRLRPSSGSGSEARKEEEGGIKARAQGRGPLLS